MKNLQFEKSKIYKIAGIEEFITDEVVIKNILDKVTGNVNAVFIDKGQLITEKLSRFDQFVEIVEGEAQVIIDDNLFCLTSGQFIIIPANSKTTILANERSKIISTTIKSGYE